MKNTNEAMLYFMLNGTLWYLIYLNKSIGGKDRIITSWMRNVGIDNDLEMKPT